MAVIANAHFWIKLILRFQRKTVLFLHKRQKDAPTPPSACLHVMMKDIVTTMRNRYGLLITILMTALMRYAVLLSPPPSTTDTNNMRYKTQS